MKVETDIIANIAASPRGQAGVLLTLFVEIFITGVIVLIGDVKINVVDITLTDNFQYQSVLAHAN